MSYEYEQFIKTIQHKADLSWDDAEQAAHVTLQTLAERLSEGEARDIARQLPGDLGESLKTDTNSEAFRGDEFLRRIGEREGVDLDTAERLARAVFVALARTISEDELEDMLAELPKDFAPLFADAVQARERDRVPKEIVPADEFVNAVANRAGLDEGAARRATEAVLETLGERLAGGEVEDLARELAPELREPLERGNGSTKGKAVAMSLDDFVERVAEREGARPSEAREHAAAAFATLREAISEKEFEDTVAELPKSYAVLLPAVVAYHR
jgi:uncharacterized protein (DUF2267 family)